MTTAPDAGSAQKIARGLVENKLAACVTALPRVRSTYRWKKKIESVQETLLLIKTTRTRWKAVERFVRGVHPYELPQLIALPVTEGSKAYLKWMEDSISGL